jgi:hypothetical protein
MATTNKIDGPKKGYLTTEFYLSSAAALLGILVASGIVDPSGGGAWDKVAGLVVSVLAALGYTIARAKVKIADSKKK